MSQVEHRGMIWQGAGLLIICCCKQGWRLLVEKAAGNWLCHGTLPEHQKRCRERPYSCSSCTCCRAWGKRGDYSDALTSYQELRSFHCSRAPKRIWRGMKRERESEQKCPRLSTYGIWTKSFSYKHSDINSTDRYHFFTSLMGIWLLLITPSLGHQKTGFLTVLQITTCRLYSLGNHFVSIPQVRAHLKSLEFLTDEFKNSCSSNYRLHVIIIFATKMPPAVAWFWFPSKTFPYFSKFSIIHIHSFKKKKI